MRLGRVLLENCFEIKNPLTPIQLTIDRLKTKYSDELNKKILKILKI